MQQKTALFPLHIDLKAKMIDFGGWMMPVQFESVIKEHQQVRTSVGVFDVSHMGEIFVSGEGARRFLQSVLVNDIEKLNPGKGQYTALCQQDGGMIDDLIIYQLSDDKYLLCVNASNIQKDFEWLNSSLGGHKCSIENHSDQISQIAIQGPKSLEALSACLDSDTIQQIEELPYMGIAQIQLDAKTGFIARTGYTGELGYEVYVPHEQAAPLWRNLLGKTPKDLVKPIGLGARDTLRLEACYLLYGNDMDESVSPLEAGISWAVALDTDFCGRDALRAQKESGIPRSSIGFRLLDKGIPRKGMDIYLDGTKIGVVTSGSMLPSLGEAGGLALVKRGVVKSGSQIHLDVRGKMKRAEVVKKPFYSARTK